MIQAALCKSAKPSVQLGSGQALRSTCLAIHLSRCLLVFCFSQRKTLPARLVSTHPSKGEPSLLPVTYHCPCFLIIFPRRVCWEYVVVATLVKKAISPIPNRSYDKKLRGKLNGLPLGSTKLFAPAQHYNIPFPTGPPLYPSSFPHIF